MRRPVFAVIVRTPNTGSTRHFGFEGGSVNASGTSMVLQRQPVAINGTVSKLYVSLTVAPGAGKSWTITGYIANTGQTLTCTISDAATSASDLVNSFTVAPGDEVHWQVAPSGTPTATQMTISAVLEGTTSGETGFSGGTEPSSNSATEYFSMYGGVGLASDALAACVMPCAGTIDKLYIAASGNMTSGNGYTATLVKNGTPTALTASVSNTTTAGNDLSNSVSFAAGDTLSMQTVPNGTPTARIIKFGMRFVPTNDGEAPLWERDTTWTVNSGVRYHSPIGNTNDPAEADTQALVPFSFVLKNLYVNIDTAPGGVTTWPIRDRKNGANGSLLATVPSAGTTASDTSNSTSYAAGDLLTWSTTSFSTQAAITRGSISAVAYDAPATPSTFSPKVIMI